MLDRNLSICILMNIRSEPLRGGMNLGPTGSGGPSGTSGRAFTRRDGRKANELRPVRITRNFISHAPGSALIEMGRTRLVVTAFYEHGVPSFLRNSGRGWVTGEYGMLPGSTPTRKVRSERFRSIDGRTAEIQRLIGRSLRAVVDLARLGEQSIWVDADVLEADGGTRTAAVTGGFVALVDCLGRMQKQELLLGWPLLGSVTAVSVGIVSGKCILDLDYAEDSSAEVDMNVVMVSSGQDARRGGRIVEVQGTAEPAYKGQAAALLTRRSFSQKQLLALLKLARKGIAQLTSLQHKALGNFPLTA